MAKELAILTISNSNEQYGAMRYSFEDSGFTDHLVRYVRLDNRRSNLHDPYRAITDALHAATEPYLIYCHQDVRADRGDGFSDLMDVLDELTRLHPDWAVTGNAGCTADWQIVRRITDMCGKDDKTHPLPQRVVSLDENFMVVRTASRIGCSPELYGFHMYGADLCLNAEAAGYSSRVIDFHIRHLGGNALDVEDLAASLRRFQEVWNKHFNLRCVRTTCTAFSLSRSPWLRATVARGRAVWWLQRHPGALRIMTLCGRWG